jgi:D-alanyl-D-alanine carboxypeptidase (penicillin-binding protein 5/6)
MKLKNLKKKMKIIWEKIIEDNRSKDKSRTYLLIFILFIFLLILIFWKPVNSEEKLVFSQVLKRPFHNPFNFVEIEAKSAYVFDSSNNKAIFAKNENAQLPLASLTKIMTSIVALEEFNPRDTVVINESALNTDGESGLLLDEGWNLSDLTKFMLVVSSNDAALAIATHMASTTESFLLKMNNKAKEIGLKQTYFLNPSGLDQSPYLSGSYGSSKDVAHMFVYAIENIESIMSTTRLNNLSIKSNDGFIHEATNTNEVALSIDGLIASKTGYTELAGGNLGIIFEKGGKRVVIVVLGSSTNGRFNDVYNLYKTSLQYLNI